MNSPKLILIAGASGSGKTTLCKALAEKLGAVQIGLDDYYYDHEDQSLEERSLLNYDVPAALEFNLLESHIKSLLSLQSIQKPIYDFALHRRSSEQSQKIAPASYIIVEGIFTFHSPVLREAATLKIFVNTPIDVCFERRLARDVKERGRSEESVHTQWNETVLPGYLEYCLPTKDYADIEINNSEAHITDYIPSILTHINFQ